MIPFSRRAVLMGLGAAGLSAAVPGPAKAQNPFQRIDGRPWFFLSDAEARFFAAAGDTLIPGDEFPSATQAGVVDFIDLQLAGPYGQGATLYLKGPFPQGTSAQGWQMPYTPADLFRRGIALMGDSGTPLADLDAEGRNDAMTRLSEGETDIGPDIPATGLFDELWALVREGYFADPIYGGNRDYAGWEMVGFPGAHAYYLDFVEVNAPYPVQPRGIAHVPGTNRPAEFPGARRGG
ncbi:gluconate 2-dehydrogenase subunit 3 family protein [Histidinibacterium lentulum]|uniref:Gluconate 2-dehydrogenase subunit 3 family protein n=1 Tax=Histidinibacterium lentulum TaxID=2480588 RepID=A0A3N2R8M1_9RHOB|nr:gluconate 2-dehydrogenase subunit 3 family protein [Histidinibacterium lentulum]ROU03768.1 gluconate 2-dehydrogenase subunit 3 family protein [Histidinibacterium lentulum]